MQAVDGHFSLESKFGFSIYSHFAITFRVDAARGFNYRSKRRRTDFILEILKSTVLYAQV